MKRLITALTAAALTCTALVATAGTAAASVSFTPREVKVPPGGVHSVIALGSVSLAMTATQTAYVYSTLRVNNASYRTLIDNEVRCTGPSWHKNVVMGQNVLAATPDAPANLKDINVTTRFLVHPGAAGTVTCTTYLRTASLGTTSSLVQLVGGSMRYADTSVANTLTGAPIQADDGDNVSRGRVIALNPGATPVREPAHDTFDTAPVTGLSVFGDMELMACHPEPAGYDCPDNFVNVQVTLFVNQWKRDGTLCKTDSTSITTTVRRDVHHQVVPLHLLFPAATGGDCIPRFNFYVKTDWLGGSTAAIQMAASGLTDSTGSTTTHAAVMSHAFAVPY
ncbi:hypothetical protein [Saccharothrix sp.]|uniref:hypothetical protein n=1 Tax=Saccharothrix sp. TaxID=1873460 RepID=UPI0028119909|nr:hypothetical protein [Saccharothrix sp.]